MTKPPNSAPPSPNKSPKSSGWTTSPKPAAWPAPSSPTPSSSTNASPVCTPASPPSAPPAAPKSPTPNTKPILAWTQILQINYWPIFAIGKDLLEQLPAADARRLLHQLRDTAAQVNAAGVDHAHDLTGRVFQRLISDRKYLATFYTLPPSAALLARLAVAKMNPIDWSDPAHIAQLRIADFACGTGALLSAVYEQIAARHDSTAAKPPISTPP